MMKASVEQFTSLEASFEKLYNETPAMLVSIDTDGFILECSDLTLQKLGHKREEAIGRKFFDFLTEQSQVYAREYVLPRLFQYGFIEDTPYQIVCKSGEIMDVLVTSRIIKDRGGELVRTNMVITDVTKKSTVDEVLRESKKAIVKPRSRALPKKYENLLQGSSDAIIISEPSTKKILDTNRGAQKLLEYSREELTKMTLFDLRTKEHSVEIKKHSDTLIEKGNVVFEGEFITKTKNSRQVEISSQVVEIDDNKLIQSFVRDISKGKLEDEKVKKFNDTLLEILNYENISGELESTFEVVTSLVLKALNVSRVSIWFFNSPKNKIVCQCLCTPNGFESGNEIAKKDFPRYFSSMESEVLIDANNAHTDHRTKEFSNPYLDPLGIMSKLDSAIRYQGEVKGVISCELQGDTRIWTLAEKNFVRSIGDVITRILGIQAIHAKNEALKITSDKYTNIFDSIIDIYYRTDSKNRIAVISPSIEKIMGLRVEDVLGETAGNFFIERQDFKNFKLQLAKNKELENFEVRMKHASGDVMSTSMNVRLEFDEQGNYLGTVGIIRDKTERKKAEDKLISSEENLKKAERLAKVGNWQFDVATNEFTCSDELLNIFGLERASGIANNRFLERVHPLDMKMGKKALMELISGTPVGAIRGRLLIDNRVKFVEVISQQHFNENHEVVKLFGTIQDITRSSLLENELQKRNTQLTIMSKIEQALAAISTNEELTSEICKILAMELNYSLVQISQLSKEKVARLELVGSYQEKTDTPIDLESEIMRGVKNPVMEAVKVMKVVSVDDIAKLRGNRNWKKLMLKSGYQSFVSVPFSHVAGVHSVLTAYSHLAGSTDKADIELLERVVNDLAIGLDLKNAQEEKKQLSEFNERLVTSLYAVLFEMDLIKMSVSLRGSTSSVLGYSISELGTDLNDFNDKIHPNDLMKILEKMRGTTSTHFDFEYRFRQPNGGYTWLHSTDQVIRDEENGIFLVTGIVINIDDKKNEQENQMRAEIQGRDKERKRIAQELHDSLGQTLTVARMSLETIGLDVDWKEGNKKVLFESTKDLVDDAIKEAREISHDLMPSSLIDFGLIPSLETDMKNIQKTTDIQFSFYHHNMPETLSDELKINLYKIIKESINNILKHSKATNSSIQLVNHDGWLILMIEDDGIGFAENDQVEHQGIGLKNLKNRVKSLGGEFFIEGKKGVSITIEIPFE